MRLTISKVKLFKSCRRAYYFKYIEDLQPVKVADALQTGTNYHELLEHLYSKGTLDDLEQDNSKELAMARAYEKYVYPRFKVRDVEKWFEYSLPDSDNEYAGDELCGITDGIAEDGCLVEHKTTGREITDEYEYNLQWDEQILGYMLATGSRKVYYTVCRKPTIRQKKNETEEEFFNRMIEWYETDTDRKIRLMEIERTNEEVDAFKKSLVLMAREMNEAEHDESRLYRNCGWCNVWGRRCEYSSICLNYDHNQNYIEFERKVEMR